MRKVINIDIPKPCSENWNNMTPNEKGRHCAACKKTVVDFTAKTDEQIIKTFEQNNNLCGRFKTTQLQRDIVLNRKDKNSYATYLASGLFAFIGLGSQYTHSQGKPNLIVNTPINSNVIIGKVAPPTSKNDTIVGFIIDEEKSPLPGANVLIKGTSIGTTTNFDGKFSLKANKGDVLVINYIGFKTKEFKLTENNTYNVVLEMTEDIMGELVGVLGGATISSCYVRTTKRLERKKQREKIRNGEIERSGVGNFFYKITSVFR